MRIIFFGTSEFSAHILRYLLDQKTSIVAVVTQPDRPRGRSSSLVFSPVKSLLSELGTERPLFQPEKSSELQFIENLKACKAELYVVVAFGQILPQELLDIPPLGCINIHASLLPLYRGAAPIQRSLMAGAKETGVSIQKMVKQLDAGDVIATVKTEIPWEMNCGELQEMLCDLSKPLLLSVLQAFENGVPQAAPQNHALATYAAKIQPEEGQIDWTQSSEVLHNLIRAFSPKPGARCWVTIGNEKKMVKILRAQAIPQKGAPGEWLANDAVVGCGKGSLRLMEVQPEGKKAMSAADWLRGFHVPPHFS